MEEVVRALWLSNLSSEGPIREEPSDAGTSTHSLSLGKLLFSSAQLLFQDYDWEVSTCPFFVLIQEHYAILSQMNY